MIKGMIQGWAVATVLVLLALGVGRSADQDLAPVAATSPAPSPSTAAAYEGLIHGRVTTDDGAVYEGPLRWGDEEEALWGNYFNGVKDGNPWAAHAPPERLKQQVPVEVLGIGVFARERNLDLDRPFMARFGDIARIEARGRDLRVTLKSGTAFDLDRFAADDLADGLRVWDEAHGVVDLREWGIRTIELLPSADAGAAPYPLHGTVRTRQGDFTGLVQWDREKAVDPDRLVGHTRGGELSLRFDSIRSIERRSRDSSLVTLLDGREIVLSGARNVGEGNRGVYVDDVRYGRVLVSWDAFERVDLSPGATGPDYGDFAPGRPLSGRVVTRSGRSLTGRLVYDLDESETTETLDAPSQGVDYTILFGLIASIALPGPDERDSELARVALHGGEVLQLERAGDLSDGNGGMLVFVGGREQAEYVPWAEVERIEFERP